MAERCVCGKQKSAGHYWATNGYRICEARAARERDAAQAAKMVCPHCQVAGGVSRRATNRGTALHCSNCGMAWSVR